MANRSRCTASTPCSAISGDRLITILATPARIQHRAFDLLGVTATA
jgi:hypothetical protein